MADRYLKIVLTVIALELFWIGANQSAPMVLAQGGAAPAKQQQPAQQAQDQTTRPIPVVVTGIELAGGPLDPARGAIPVVSARALEIAAGAPLTVVGAGPLAVVGAAPLKVEADVPIPVRADEPLSVRSVPYTPGKTPGE